MLREKILNIGPDMMETLTLLLAPDVAIRAALPPSCGDCRIGQEKRADELAFWLGGRVPTVKKAVSLLLEDYDCLHYGQEITHNSDKLLSDTIDTISGSINRLAREDVSRFGLLD